MSCDSPLGAVNQKHGVSRPEETTCARPMTSEDWFYEETREAVRLSELKPILGGQKTADDEGSKNSSIFPDTCWFVGCVWFGSFFCKSSISSLCDRFDNITP